MAGVTVRMRGESAMVRPAADTPQESIWISNLDKFQPSRHAPVLHLYEPNNLAAAGAGNFFDTHIMKDALSKALVPFYPLAGRLRRRKEDQHGVDIEIDCNAEGVQFAVADSNSCMSDFGDCAPGPGFGEGLIPTVDYSSSPPLFLVQITYLKCGGVALGLNMDHRVLDGISAVHFISTWSRMARGLDVAIQPSMDRTILRARDPPRPLPDHLHHIEFPPPPTTVPNFETTVANFRFTKEQINILKARSIADDDEQEQQVPNKKFTSYQVFAGHVWRCACKARELADEQETVLYISVDGRSRFRPPLPEGYFGNVVSRTAATALAGDLISKPIQYAASCVRKAVLRMDDDYLRSTIDYLELEQRHCELSSLAHGTHVRCPNLAINSWSTLAVYDSDFGWGRPVFVRRPEILSEGKAFMVPSATDDGSLSLSISLQSQHMKAFSNLVYDLGSLV